MDTDATQNEAVTLRNLSLDVRRSDRWWRVSWAKVRRSLKL